MIPDKPKVLEQAKQIDAKSGKFREMKTRFNTTNVKNTETCYKLADLLAQCSPNASVPEDSIAWNMMGSAGKEIVET